MDNTACYIGKQKYIHKLSGAIPYDYYSVSPIVDLFFFLISLLFLLLLRDIAVTNICKFINNMRISKKKLRLGKMG